MAVVTTPSEVRRRGRIVDVAQRGDVFADGRLLSVAELQQALRELGRNEMQARPRGTSSAAVGDLPTADTDPGPVDAVGGQGPGVERPLHLGQGWVAVVAASSGAGASTVALALADAAAGASGLPVHLVDPGRPSRSGLVGVAAAELGLHQGGQWRRGRRSSVVVDRRATLAPPAGWPGSPEGVVLTVVDLGSPGADELRRLDSSGTRLVVVGRATVPGVRGVEQLLSRFGGPPAGCALVGPDRWHGEVTSSVGPRLRRLLASGRVVRVPVDRRLEVAGLSCEPLPKAILGAGAALLRLIDGPTATPSHSAAPHRRRGLARKGRIA